MIRSAKRAGVGAPYLFFVDTESSTLVMEFVDGQRMKDLVSQIPAKETAALFELLGAGVANLHRAGIMHGDLTTANVLRRDGKLVFVDFGLSVHSSRVEDHAVDLRLIKETIVGAHSDVAQHAISSLFEGYGRGVGAKRAGAVLRQLRSIERRGRYARVE